MKHKFLKLLLASILLLCTIVANAHDFEVNNIYYNITDSINNTVEVTYRGNTATEYTYEYSGSVVIPSSVTYNGVKYDVTSIGLTAFWKCSSLTSIKIPNSVKTIGDSAFGYSGLTSVTIPNSVTTIEFGVFQSCSNLKSVTIPNSVISIGEYAFEYCRKLTSITIPNSVTNISSGAFYVCSSLENITLSNNLESLGSSSFFGTAWYNNHADGVMYLGNFLYQYKGTMPENTSITIEEGTLGIADCAFQSCKTLKSINMPDGLEIIGGSAFYGCTGLKSIEFPDGIRIIGGSAFSDCTGLTRIELPNSITTIGSYAFDRCTNITGVYINDLQSWCNIDFYNDTSNPLALAKTLYLNDNRVTNLILPDSITAVKDYTFYNCSGLKSVEIPASVTSIGNEAFYGCSNLTTVFNNSELNIVKDSKDNGYVAYYSYVVIGKDDVCVGDYYFNTTDSVHTLVYYKGYATKLSLPSSYNGESYKIGNSAFRANLNLKNVEIPDSVTGICEYAFNGCYNLATITVGNMVKSIGNAAFYNCSSLKIVINQSNLSLTKSSKNYGYVAYYAYVVIGKDDVLVDDFYFKTTDGVHTLAYYKGTEAELSLPENYNGESYKIGIYAFNECNSLKRVEISDSVTSIGECAFYNCSNLKSVVIGKSITSIDGYTFFNCKNLKTVINKSALSLTKGSTSYGYVAYYADAVIVITNDDVLVGDFYFNTTDSVHTLVYYQGNATELSLPNDYNGDNYNIGTYAFYNCRDLKSLVIPNSVTSIGNSAFNSCSSLKELYIEDGENELSVGCHTYNTSSTGKGMFCDCPLETLYIGRDLSYSTSYTRGYSPFYNVRTLASVTIGNNVMSIWGYAFYYCSGLTKIEIKGDITSIAANAFWGCNRLESVIIPSSVTSIENSAFGNCSSLTSITSLIPADDLFVVATSTFSNVDKNTCTLYVPYGAKEVYASTDGWKLFANIVEMEPTEIDSLEAINGNVATIYDLSGRIIESPTNGIYIVNGKKVLLK